MCAGSTVIANVADSHTSIVLENSRSRKLRNPGFDAWADLSGTRICRPALRNGWEKSKAFSRWEVIEIATAPTSA